MRLGNISAHNIAAPLVNILFLADNLDPASTARRRRFHNVHILEVADFALENEPFIVLGEYVGRGSDVESLAIQATHALYVAPHLIFATDAPRACKMVDLLLTVEILDATLFEEPGPTDVPV